MPGRALWKGYLKLSLVSCPIALYPATSAAERIFFRQINKRTGNRLRHRLVDSVTGETVESREKGRGYEIGENRFVQVEDIELERARQSCPQPGAIALVEPATRVEKRVQHLGAAMSYAETIRGAAEEPDDIDEIDDVAPAPILRPQNTHTLEIERFLPAGQMTPAITRSPTTSCRETRSARRPTR